MIFGATSKAAEVEADGGSFAACFGSETGGSPSPDIIRYSILLEALFAGPTGQVDGYASGATGVAPVFDPQPESGAGFQKLEDVSAGMQDYCLDIVRSYGASILYAEFDPDMAIAPLRQLINGWGGIPADLRPVLVVDDAFCGATEKLDAVQVLEKVTGETL